MCLVCDRRGLLRGIAATALGGAWAYPASAQARRDAPDAGKLPPKGEYLLKGAFVMTMDPQLGNISKGSVHVKDGEIVDVDAAISAPGAEVIDADGMIVLPGLVETHWQRWSSLLRSMAIGEQKYGYFPTAAAFGRHFLPNDIYCGVRLATAEAIDSGITCVHDWAHHFRTPEHADENLRALRESGMRGRFSYGPARGVPITETLDLGDVERLHQSWKPHSNDGMLSLGLA